MTRHFQLPPLLAAALVLNLTTRGTADGPNDNIPVKVRPVPKVGIELSESQTADFAKRLSEFKRLLDKLRAKKDRRTLELLPDVEIFDRAVRTNIEHRELFGKRDVVNAAVLTNEGHSRAADLLYHKPQWPAATGLVVRGYRSKIDGSVQPYGLVVPESYNRRDRAHATGSTSGSTAAAKRSAR